MDSLLLHVLDGRRQPAHQLHGGEQRALQRRRQPRLGGHALRRHAQLAERVARVGVAARGVAPRHEVVVHER